MPTDIVLSFGKMVSFQPEYEFLSALAKDWGTVTLLPWDEKIFGFPVADFQFGGNPSQIEDLPLFVAALEEFSIRTNVQLISTHARAEDTAAIALLVKAGFSPVDFSLLATLSRIKPAQLPPRRFAIRKALPEDHAALFQIAGSAFQFGRYHTDPRFPRELANARYQHWIRNALSGSNPNDFVFVLGGPGEVVGFMNVVICDGHADLRLGGVDPGKNLGFAGVSLFVESLRAVAELGAKSASAKIAAANTRAMNVYSMLGFQFSKPEVVLHWHAPFSSRLLA
jgi:RimJ/RimL family protein N-acetyltransferase